MTCFFGEVTKQRSIASPVSVIDDERMEVKVNEELIKILEKCLRIIIAWMRDFF
jgi:hypothetical protein